MPEFAYRAVSSNGRARTGVEQAPSAAALERSLGTRGLYPVEISTTRDRRIGRRRWRRRRSDVADGIRYLATLLESGFPLDRALATCVRLSARRDVADALRRARERVRGGMSLADALEEHPRLFPRVAVGMIRAGERGGHLADALGRLAAHLEREEMLRARTAAALLYPATIAFVGGAAVLVLLVYVLPKFAALFADVGAALPRSTAMLIAMGELLGTRWPWLALAGAALVAVGWAGFGTPAGRRIVDRLLLELPIIGGLRRNAIAARLGRSLSTLLQSGLPIVPALEIAADSVGDATAADELRQAREEVSAGAGLAGALRRARALPFLFGQMVDAGEEGGRLPEMLDRAAAMAERDLERGMEGAVRLIEPALIVAFGTVAGLVALSLLQAIYGFGSGGF